MGDVVCLREWKKFLGSELKFFLWEFKNVLLKFFSFGVAYQMGQF